MIIFSLPKWQDCHELWSKKQRRKAEGRNSDGTWPEKKDSDSKSSKPISVASESKDAGKVADVAEPDRGLAARLDRLLEEEPSQISLGRLALLLLSHAEHIVIQPDEPLVGLPALLEAHGLTRKLLQRSPGSLSTHPEDPLFALHQSLVASEDLREALVAALEADPIPPLGETDALYGDLPPPPPPSRGYKPDPYASRPPPPPPPLLHSRRTYHRYRAPDPDYSLPQPPAPPPPSSPPGDEMYDECYEERYGYRRYHERRADGYGGWDI